MWKFELPWAFVLLPLPLLVWWLAPAWRTAALAVRMPFFHEMAEAVGEKPAPGGVRLRSNWLQRLLMPLLWVLLVIAAARPVYVEAPVSHEDSARDLILAIDLSQSMSTPDFVNGTTGERMDRLSAVKHVVADFIARRKTDRIGLVVFGQAAYPQAPLTLDHDSTLILLNQMQIGMAGARTAIGDAIGMTVKMMDNSTAPDKLMILLTDGNDTASQIPPEQAAQIAHAHNLTIDTIGIGDPDATGEDKVDLDALKQIADITGGHAYQALGKEEELADVYATVDRLAPAHIRRETWRPQRDFYWIPLGAALLLFTGYHVTAWLIAMLRASRRRPLATQMPTQTQMQQPVEIAESQHGN